MEQTSKKRPTKPFKGAIDGTPFSKENQPSAELKKAGWEERRKERLFTSQVWVELVGKTGLPLKVFTKKLIRLAEKGNPKAIEKIVGAIEDDNPIKIELPQTTTIRIIRDTNV